MADVGKKINVLTSRISEIDDKMKKLAQQKKEFEKQLKELNEQEIVKAVKDNGIDVATLNDDLALIKLLRDNNLSKEDLLDLISPNN
ncbi:MAG: hypothetical protein U0K87_13620 [Ruminococcus sp.]|nr:hypothetical protein [Ruminococcus sp.]